MTAAVRPGTYQSNSSAYYLLGQVLVKEGRIEEGKKLLDRFRELNGGSH